MGAGAHTILALDVGSVRIGIARANTLARIAAPLMTIANDSRVFERLQELCEAESVATLVLGLPRGLSGQSTAQTAIVEAFGAELHSHLSLPMYWQDEALTSVQAEAELQRRGTTYHKGDVDALAAVYILEDYLREHL